jgi:uncharacterized glyoxalase superfamily protein PhnB
VTALSPGGNVARVRRAASHGGQVNPYLSFNGQCEAAFEFYEQCLGGQLGEIFRYAGTPLADQVPADGGRLVVPLEKTFWAARFGMLVDRFRIPWLINCDGSDQPLEG